MHSQDNFRKVYQETYGTPDFDVIVLYEAFRFGFLGLADNILEALNLMSRVGNDYSGIVRAYKLGANDSPWPSYDPYLEALLEVVNKEAHDHAK